MKKLDGPLNVKFINRTFFPEYKDVSVINEGECFLWAYITFKVYKDVELWDMGAHAFVRSKLDGKFYDSERPQGEEDWKDLPATNFGEGCGCSVCQRPAKQYKTIVRFKKSWTGMTKRFGVKWEEVDANIHKVLREHAK